MQRGKSIAVALAVWKKPGSSVSRIMTHSRVLEWSKNLGVINNDRDTGEDSDSQDEDDETLWD
jgi:hypothetical protein